MARPTRVPPMLYLTIGLSAANTCAMHKDSYGPAYHRRRDAAPRCQRQGGVGGEGLVQG
jgi:hypothetical protein